MDDKAFPLKLLMFTALLILMYPKTQCRWVQRGLRRPRPRPHPYLPRGPNPYLPRGPNPYIPRGPIPIDPTSPLCQNQFTLANRACVMIPYMSVPPPAPPAELGSGHHHHRRHHHHHHRHHHHQMLGNGTSTGTPAEEECCRWLKEIDDVCVCTVLARLPIFLSRPTHNYTVVVGETCNVAFQCVPRVMQLRT